MPRTGRLILPGYPHHIVQRGHNRQVVFAAADDYRRYLDTLAEFKDVFDVEVYAWCLMVDHVHLLMAPREEAASIGCLMKRLAGRHTRHRNRLEGRTGTLWESRYKSSPVDTDRHLLACVRYIELNPVRARVVDDPEIYPWSSCRHRLAHGSDECLDEDPRYRSLGATHAERAARYRQFLKEAVPEGEWAFIREAVRRGHLTGSERFVERVAAAVGRRLIRRPPGRPRKCNPGEG